MYKLLFIFLIFTMLHLPVMADVRSSKINSYSVVGPQDGISASKLNSYSVVGPPDGISASKLNSYSVVGPPDGIAASKMVGYAVLETPSVRKQPTTVIFTKNDLNSENTYQ